MMDACKTYLIPEDIVNQWRADQREKHVDQPEATHTQSLDHQMQNILQQKDVSDYDKEKLYSQTLAKYLSLRDQHQHQHQQQQSVAKVPQTKINEEQVMSSVPKMYRQKAQALLQFLQSDPEVQWDDRGQLVLSGQVVPKSHIIDLVNDALRRRKSHAPHGWDALSRRLRQHNVPKELVGNEKWSVASEDEHEDSDDWHSLPASSPQHGTPIKKPKPSHKFQFSAKAPRKSKVRAVKKIRSWINF
jgi:hypothetical protein